MSTAYPGTARIMPSTPNIFPAKIITKIIVIGWIFSDLPMICGEMNLPSISWTAVQTKIIFSSIKGEVTSATINAGVIAMAGPR
ncbi:hypothetical protein D3C80_1591130 [compost metagenome]